MKTIRWIVFLLALAPVWLKASDTPHSAKIIAVTGSVSVTTETGSSVGVVGTEVPVGATVKTAPGGQASLQLFDGVVAVVQEDTVVTLQTCSASSDKGASKEHTLLDVRVGGVVASLDPAKKNISDFKVRTPRGVAAARGTVLAVRVKGGADSSVTTLHGTVTFMTDKGEVTVGFGQVGQAGGVTSVADAVKANPAFAAEIIAAVSSVSSSIGKGAITNTQQSPNLIATVLAALVDVAVQASPDHAAEIVRNMITAAGPAIKGADGVRIAEAIAKSAIRSAARAGQSDSADIIAAARESAAAAGIPGVFGRSSSRDIILPLVDQIQPIVSPSAP